jgi:hypothetical protein
MYLKKIKKPMFRRSKIPKLGSQSSSNSDSDLAERKEMAKSAEEAAFDVIKWAEKEEERLWGKKIRNRKERQSDGRNASLVPLEDNYPHRVDSSIFDNLASETVVDILRFTAREYLEVVQLVSKKFNGYVIRFFPMYPLRLIHSVEARTVKGVPETKFVCLPVAGKKQQSVETNDEDIHLWLKNSYISHRLDFTDFHFTENTLAPFDDINSSPIIANQCIFDFRRKESKSGPAISKDRLRRLFDNVLQCKKFIICADPCSGFQPSLGTCFRLPATVLVMDFKFFVVSEESINKFTTWLCGGSSGEQRTLCLKRFEWSQTATSQLVSSLRREFLAATEPHPFYLTFEKDENVDEQWDDNELWPMELTNEIGERLAVRDDAFLEYDHMTVSRQ